MARKVLIVTCVVSLFVNLALIGYLVGRSFGPDIRTDRSAVRFGSSMEGILRPLAHERVQELLPLTREHRKQIRSHMDEIRAAQIELYLATVSEPFDRNRLKAAHERFNTLFLDAKVRQDQMWLTLADKLTPDERKRIMQASMPRRHNEARRYGKRDEKTK